MFFFLKKNFPQNKRKKPKKNPPPSPLAKLNKAIIMTEDVMRLEPEQLLNDNLIDFYFSMLASKDDGTCAFFSTKFFTKLSQKGFEGVSSWNKEINIFDLKKIFIPIHKHNHWVLGIINYEAKRLEYYDSLLENKEVNEDLKVSH